MCMETAEACSLQVTPAEGRAYLSYDGPVAGCSKQGAAVNRLQSPCLALQIPCLACCVQVSVMVPARLACPPSCCGCAACACCAASCASTGTPRRLTGTCTTSSTCRWAQWRCRAASSCRGTFGSGLHRQPVDGLGFLRPVEPAVHWLEAGRRLAHQPSPSQHAVSAVAPRQMGNLSGMLCHRWHHSRWATCVCMDVAGSLLSPLMSIASWVAITFRSYCPALCAAGQG